MKGWHFYIFNLNKYLSLVIHTISLLILTTAADVIATVNQTFAQKRATGVKYYQVFLQGWIHRSLSVNSKIRKANGPSSRSRKAVICSRPPSPARTKSSRTHALIQLAGISAHPPLPFAGLLWILGIRDAVTHHQPVKWEARALYGCWSGEG